MWSSPGGGWCVCTQVAPHSPKARLVQRLWCLSSPLQPTAAAGAGAQAPEPGGGRPRGPPAHQLSCNNTLLVATLLATAFSHSSCPPPPPPGRARNAFQVCFLLGGDFFGRGKLSHSSKHGRETARLLPSDEFFYIYIHMYMRGLLFFFAFLQEELSSLD